MGIGSPSMTALPLFGEPQPEQSMARIHARLRALEFDSARRPHDVWEAAYLEDIAWLLAEQGRTPAHPFDAPAYYARGSETSRAAAVSLGRDGAKQRRRVVLAAIVSAGERGLTCDECEQVLGWSHQSTSARVFDLHKSGDIYDSGRRRKTRSRRDAIVWRAHAR